MSPDDLPTDLLDQAELTTLGQAMECLASTPAALEVVKENVARLARLGEVVRSFPSLDSRERLGGRYRSRKTLVDRLARDAAASPLRVPIKARLASDFVLAKVQAFKAILLALEAPDCDACAELKESMRREVGQSIYTLLIEDVLEEILLDDETSQRVSRKAGDILVSYWENSIEMEVEDFCPMLASAWEARNELVVDFGTLMGSIEIQRLSEASSSPEFIDLFLRRKNTREELRAFEEFLFGLPFEQLAVLRAEMAEKSLIVVDREWVAKTLNLPKERMFSGVTDPEAMFDSYHRRLLASSYRRVFGADGPCRTAEMFLMIRILERS